MRYAENPTVPANFSRTPCRRSVEDSSSQKLTEVLGFPAGKKTPAIPGLMRGRHRYLVIAKAPLTAPVGFESNSGDPGIALKSPVV